VSSIGIEEGRVNGVHFDVATFTNLTQDHLDYHGSMAAYGAAKHRLFAWPGLTAAVVNLDDPFGVELAGDVDDGLELIGYTLTGQRGGKRTLAAEALTMAGAEMSFTLDGIKFRAPVVGRFNASNLLAVIGTLLAAGYRLAEIAGVLPGLAPPPGRMQALGAGAGQPLVVVDYAHTPDALEKALAALRETATARRGKLICVFGCGGDRDRGKRPQMGAAAERLADRVIVSSDNPRFEDPRIIIDDILAGMTSSPLIEADRAAAIRSAIGSADPSDVVLLAGKGHEAYQEVAGQRLPFSDLEHARAALEPRS
jgi:UDP-N-acetylmuramoyl-L-alanyl-D-glutamate--2,6-diaminopimelate ligase